MSDTQELFFAFGTKDGKWSYLVPDGKGGFREDGRFENREDAKYSAGKARRAFEASKSGAGAITGQDKVRVF